MTVAAEDLLSLGTASISHLLIRRGRKHLLLMGVLGEVKGIGHHQVAPMQAG